MRLLRNHKLIPLLIVGIGLLAYLNTFGNQFIFDDVLHIVQNLRIRHLWPLSEGVSHSSRPVVQLSLALNYALGGLNPWGYHLFNVCVHILAALTLYGLVRRTLLAEDLRSRWQTTAPWLAGVVSLIWLVHPIQTESVTYTIQRSESLMGLFYLLTLYCVIRSVGSSRRVWWWAGAVASCGLGMASKPVMVTAPVVALLYDRAFLAPSWREVRKQRWPLYACLAATWLLLPLLLASAPAEWKGSAGFAFAGITPLQYALTQLKAVLHYLWLAFWPHPLCLDYGWQYGWPVPQTAGDVLPELIVVGALLAITAWAWWRKPALGFLGVWFFMILAPTSSFVPLADLVFEHRIYLPLAAVVAMVIIGGFELVARITPQPARNRFGLIVGGTLVLLLGILTIQRNRDYRSELTIWQDTVAKLPNNPRAHCNLGHVLIRLGETQEAIRHCELAVQIKPDYAMAHGNLGSALAQAERYEEAIEHFDLARQLQPDIVEAHFNMGRALGLLGRLKEAVEPYEQALRLKPNDAEAHGELGNILLRLGNVPQAMDHWEQAVRIKPDYMDARNNLGAALAQAGRFQEAIEQLEQVVRMTPDDVEARCNLGNALLASGNPREAINHYELALKNKSTHPGALNDLARLLATVPPSKGGDPLRAVGLAQQASELTGNEVAACVDTLAVAYAAAGRFDDAVVTAQKALTLAQAAGLPELVREIEIRLQLYRARHASEPAVEVTKP